MSDASLPPVEPGNKLALNIMHFARALRAAGVPVGPGKMLDAIAAIEAVGVMRRDDFYAALRSTLCERREHFEVFDQAFKLFWRDPRVVERLLSLLFSKGRHVPLEGGGSSRRVTDALSSPAQRDERDEPKVEIEFDAALRCCRPAISNRCRPRNWRRPRRRSARSGSRSWRCRHGASASIRTVRALTCGPA